jgi:dolichyl-diphosphooligosaccharide--protein glycosyltransferase
MRKRAQMRSRPTIEESKSVYEPTRLTVEKRPFKFKKNWLIAVTLIGIFFLVLFFNTYFNFTSGQTVNVEGEGFDKYYLSGPDPYYNMRLVNETIETGRYPYYSDQDPLLNYPLGRTGGRPPLLNMLAIGFGRLLTPFMNEVDAVGYSMQFIPALFGALIVFPVYFIGKTIFGRREGLAAALFVAIIPIHLSSGHGSAYSLFDHDSLNLLLYFLAFLFLIKGMKEKDSIKSILFALLSGISVAALSMTWTEAQFIYVVIAAYAIIQMLIDIFTGKIEITVIRTTLVALLTGYLIFLPVRVVKFGGSITDLPMFLCLGLTAFGAAYYFFGYKRIPWTLSLPTIFCAGGIGVVFIYFINDISIHLPFLSALSRLRDILFGSGVYGGKVSLTIAEAHTYGISQTVMSFGPVLYWLAWAGFIFLAYHYYKGKHRRDYLFIIVLFIVNLWLAGIAGRFLNDMVPLVAILGGWIALVIVDKIDYKQMLRNIRGAGGGIHGLRRGVKFLHIFGILFIALLVIFPNAYLAFDAGVPYSKKPEVFGDLPSGAFGLPHPGSKESYWVDAFNWLNKQDIDIENPVERPAFISWWDYGFYESAIGDHPTVADNFQDGIPPAANFHTATSEEEAVAVWIVRILEGDLKDNNGTISEDVIQIFEKYVGANDTVNITNWIETPTNSPSYNDPIGAEYDENLSKEYLVGEQHPMNAVYHDVPNLLTDKLDDEGITWLYHELQEATDYSIRYYGVEGYDSQIFNIFGFLGDKSLLMVSGAPYAAFNPEDDFQQIKYVRQSGAEINYSELKDLSEDEWIRDPPVINQQGVYNTKTYYKDLYFETMFYRTYVGISEGQPGSKYEPNYHLPCFGMRHFYAEHISNIYQYPSPYTSKSAVVIAKYYEGAYINGSTTFGGDPIQVEVVVMKNITAYNMSIPLDHDKITTDSDGKFNLIAPAGEITLQVRRYPNINPVILKNVTFNSSTDPRLYPISDDDAMRRSNNYERSVNISIEEANLEGYVYINKDNDTSYNNSIDDPLPSALVTVYELQDDGSSVIERAKLISDENGYYNTSGLIPGLYVIRAEHDGYILHDSIPAIKLLPGDTFYNISKPEPASVEGKIYYDEDHDTEYDTGEELENVEVDIIYQKLSIDGASMIDEFLVDTLQTDQNGFYSFSSLIPGIYTINATKYPDYEAEEKIELEANITASFNVSMSLVPVTVSGYTNYEDEVVGNISIIFSSNGSVENNTAASLQTVTSDNTTGFYEIMLTPGHYNISINETKFEDNQNVTYVFGGQLELNIGEGTKTFDIIMTREED